MMRPSISCLQRLAITISLMLLILTPVFAQVDTGTILGTVTDASGAVVAGARVTLTSLDTNSALSTNTGGDGTYKFSPVKIGNYKVEVSSQGFQTMTQRNISVDVNSDVVANFSLKPGSVTEVLEVTAAPPVLETQSAAVGQVIDRHEVDNLPLNGRNYTFLAQLAAGVNTPQADTRGNAASGAFSANGLRPAQNNYLLDGIDNNSDAVDFLNGTNYVVLPPVDAIQEFKVQTSDFSAEYGRSGAAVLNATIKSGTNNLHGTIWEFFRNDKLDAADYFEKLCPNGVCQTEKGKLRQNQFGLAAGGPVVIPHLFDGRNRLFFFADYEGLRRRQGSIFTASVPTLAERSSGFTNFQDLISLQSGAPKTDALGRSIPVGAILDPATTRPVTAGQVDPVSGLVATSTGFARDPFGTCAPSTMVFTLAACGLNILPAGRLDPNAIKLLDLYPSANTSGLSSNFINSPLLTEDRNSFDTRIDANVSQKDQGFFRFSYGNDPQFIPGPFGGVADGGGFASGIQTAVSKQGALAETHIFSPKLVNVARVGLTDLHTTRQSPTNADLSNIPAQFGIQGVPQVMVDGLGNGGLPNFTFNNLSVLGTSTFLPSNEVSATFQATDDLTKISGKHTFHMGVEFQDVQFTTLQPPRGRSEYDYNGSYVNIPGNSSSDIGTAEFLLTPIATTVPGGINFVGGSSQVRFSNISVIHDVKQYVGPYFQDDWKVTQRLTLNLGLRWDFFGLVGEKNGEQANFVPSGPPGGPVYILPAAPASMNLSTGCATCFTNLLAKDGIALATTNQYGAGLGNSQYTNFAPRFGFAFQVTPRLVARGGFGMFYNGFENRGFSPNEGLNYPFIFKFTFNQPNDHAPLVFSNAAGNGPCTSAGPGGSAVFETGFSCTPVNPLSINAQGLALQGIQFNYQTPYTMGSNFTLEYEVTPTLAVQAAYVNTLARHLEVFPQDNNVTQILPASANAQTAVPFPDFARQGNLTATAGNSFYHGLQTKAEKRFSGGLSFLATYTYSKVRSDAIDLLNQGSVSGTNYRAAGILGIKADYSDAPFDIRNVVHLSGTYELPFGKGKRFMSSAGGLANALGGGWSIVWASTFQGGQPVNIPCPSNTTAGTTCNAILIPGQDPYAGPHNAVQFFNPAAFTQPCVLGANDVPIANSPKGCIPLTGAAALGGAPTQVEGPGYDRFDFSTFKEFPIKERFHLQFRAEIFNIANHPNFNAPGFGGNNVFAVPNSLNFTIPSAFGAIGSTRDAPYDAREVQFALKLYY